MLRRIHRLLLVQKVAWSVHFSLALWGFFWNSGGEVEIRIHVIHDADGRKPLEGIPCSSMCAMIHGSVASYMRFSSCQHRDRNSFQYSYSSHIFDMVDDASIMYVLIVHDLSIKLVLTTCVKAVLNPLKDLDAKCRAWGICSYIVFEGGIN